MVAANEVMSPRADCAFMDEYGLDDVEGLGYAIHSRSEAHMRKAISRLAARAATSAEVTLDGFETDVTLNINVQVRARLDPCRLRRHLARRCARGINVRAALPLRAHGLRAEMPARSRHAEQRRLHAADHRRGAGWLDPQPRNTAAGNLRNLIGHVIPSLIFRALEGVVPDASRATAAARRSGASTARARTELGEQYGATPRISTAGRADAPRPTASTR